MGWPWEEAKKLADNVTNYAKGQIGGSLNAVMPGLLQNANPLDSSLVTGAGMPWQAGNGWDIKDSTLGQGSINTGAGMPWSEGNKNSPNDYAAAILGGRVGNDLAEQVNKVSPIPIKRDPVSDFINDKVYGERDPERDISSFDLGGTERAQGEQQALSDTRGLEQQRQQLEAQRAEQASKLRQDQANTYGTRQTQTQDVTGAMDAYRRARGVAQKSKGRQLYKSFGA